MIKTSAMAATARRGRKTSAESTIIDAPIAKMTWVKTAPNAYAAALKPPNGKTAMVFRYEMRVAAPERIDGKALVIVSIPGMKTCRIETPVSYRRT